MLNWDELKHIHVIRKLEEILAGWFHTDIFFLDELGHFRNVNLESKQSDCKNPLLKALLATERGRLLFQKTMSEACIPFYQSSERSLKRVGLIGSEHFFLTKIIAEHEPLGSVLAYSFLDHSPSSEQKQKIMDSLSALGFELAPFEEALSVAQVLSATQEQYFHELVELVAQEVVTFHTEISRREEKINALSQQLGVRYSYDSMIGKSKPMQELYQLLDKIQNSEATVLIQGENGTGKELIARALHYNSRRKTAQFITINCSAFNENLLDSELFGHVKGAFTGAVRDKKGLFEAADKGTLFLDEIGDMPLAMQVKLLRVLQNGTLLPVGATETKKVDVRVIAATNKDLKEMIEESSFREDLYYRINVINLLVPPLRDRKDDIPILVEHFLSQNCKEKNLPTKIFAKRTMEKIFDYPWPGNIRELENEMERLVVLSGEDLSVPPELLSARIRDHNEQARVQGVRVAGRLRDSLEELEKAMIREGLKRTNWNKSRLAKELGISRAGLIMKVEKYHLERRRLPRPGEAA